MKGLLTFALIVLSFSSMAFDTIFSLSIVHSYNTKADSILHLEMGNGAHGTLLCSPSNKAIIQIDGRNLIRTDANCISLNNLLLNPTTEEPITIEMKKTIVNKKILFNITKVNIKL